MPTPALVIDVETRSTTSIKLGANAYARHPNTDIWCACWAIGDGPVETWRPGEPVPPAIAEHVEAGHPVIAHNVGFERAIWRWILSPRYGWPEPELTVWDCTAARAAAMALPRDLEGAARALGLPAQKDLEGHRLMLRMARPRALNGDGAPVWWDEPERRARLEQYCKRDVQVERMLHRRLRPLDPPEREIFLLDQAINDRGVMVDLRAARAAQTLVERELRRLNAEMRRVTGGAVPGVTNLAALLAWLNSHDLATPFEKLDAEAIREALNGGGGDLPPICRRALEIRAEAAKSSTAKLRAFIERAGPDGRVRDSLVFHGAATGRWSGRGVQLQNLPRVSLLRDRDPEEIMTAIDAGEDLSRFGPPLTVVAESLRSLIVASPAHNLLGADFAAIEARVLAWLADERALLEAFSTGRDVYKEMASRIYRIPADQIGDDSLERRIGKAVVLGCGYQMGAPRFREEMRKQGIVLAAAEAENIIAAYRGTNARIVALWYELERAAMRAVAEPGVIVPIAGGRARFRVRSGFLWLQLPSGRLLAYAKPRIEEREAPWGEMRPVVTFVGVGTYTHKWERQQAYGGRWTENLVQAASRDLMAAAMLRLERAGYLVVLTVHDEVVAEVPRHLRRRRLPLERFERLMAEAPSWAEGCPIRAKGWRGSRYAKGS